MPSGCPTYSPPSDSWATLLTPYLAGANFGTVRCPGNRVPVNDYGYNDYGTAPKGVGFPLSALGLSGAGKPIPESGVRVPSDMIALGDSFKERNRLVFADPWIELGINMGKLTGFPQALTNGPAWARQRHRATANIVFCDGHVETWKNARLFLEPSDPVLRKWNNDNEPHRELLR